MLASKDAAPATGDGTSSAGSAGSSDTAAKAESRANVLYTKGAASASGFRPDQWSFDPPAAAPEPPRLVMPFPAKAIAPPAIVQPPRMAAARKLMLSGAAIAVAACVAVGIAIVARPPQRAALPVAALPAAPNKPSASAAPHVAAAPVAAPDAASADEIAALKARADQLVAAG
ncbi:MAG TPA: hypothetical protein VF113_09065, partial [Stellaceae bacterium]